MTDFSFVRGDTKTFNLTLLQEPGGDALDLTDVGLKFSARRSYGHSDTIFEKSSADPDEIEIIDAAAGRADVHILPADTASLDPHQVQLVYDVEITQNDGTVTTPDESRGRLSIDPDVTHT